MAGAECPAPFLFRDRDLFKTPYQGGQESSSPFLNGLSGQQERSWGREPEASHVCFKVTQQERRAFKRSNCAHLQSSQRMHKLHTLHYQTWL